MSNISEQLKKSCRDLPATRLNPGEMSGWWVEMPTGWQPTADGLALRQTWSFPDFASALAFVNRIGPLADEQDHHPDIELGWGRVVVTITTHSAGGITPKDFALAKRISEL